MYAACWRMLLTYYLLDVGVRLLLNLKSEVAYHLPIDQYGFFCVRFVFSPRSSVTMKGGWAGVKVASASNQQGTKGRQADPVSVTS